MQVQIFRILFSKSINFHVLIQHSVHIDFVCLFCGFSSHLRIFHLFGYVTITGEGLQILTYTRSENSLTCHIYYVFYNGYLRGPVTPTLNIERTAVELSLPVLTTQVCLDRGSNPDLHARRPLYNYAIMAVSPH